MADKEIAALKPWIGPEPDRADDDDIKGLLATLTDAGYEVELKEVDNPFRPIDDDYYVIKEGDAR